MKEKSKLARLTDSPGLWALIFCGFGLVMLQVGGSKIQRRLDNIEARQGYAASASRGESNPYESLYPKYTLTRLRVILACGAALGLLMTCVKIWRLR